MRIWPIWAVLVVFSFGAGFALAPLLPNISARPAPQATQNQPAQTSIQVRAVESGLLNFDMRIVNAAEPIEGQAGSLATLDGRLLIARRTDGVLLAYDPAADAIAELSIVLPSANADKLPARFATGRRVRPSDFRYHDILIMDGPDGARLLVTYNFYDDARSCFGMRLDEATLPQDWLSGENGAQVDWTTRFESTPCLAPSDDRNTFGGNQGGGRMAAASDGSVLFTTGDFEFDGLGRKSPAVSQGDDSTLGRVMRLDLATGALSEVSRGHRNAQGLAIDDAGTIWLAEHGAMGGDELNLIVAGGNYGWPLVTLGIFYTTSNSDAKSWPGNPDQGRHRGFVPPVFAWMPSIAPSAMEVIRDIDPRWDGDLLIATLAGQSLHRLRMEGATVLYDERIAIDARVRDLALLDGRIYLLLDDGRLAMLTPHDMTDMIIGPFATTTAIYQAGCVECHARPGVPRLAGVAGATIASQAGVAYSEPLATKGGVWTRAALDAFLQSPNDFAPGTTMPNPQLDDAARAAVLDELEALKP